MTSSCLWSQEWALARFWAAVRTSDFGMVWVLYLLLNSPNIEARRRASLSAAFKMRVATHRRSVFLLLILVFSDAYVQPLLLLRAKPQRLGDSALRWCHWSYKRPNYQRKSLCYWTCRLRLWLYWLVLVLPRARSLWQWKQSGAVAFPGSNGHFLGQVCSEQERSLGLTMIPHSKLLRRLLIEVRAFKWSCLRKYYLLPYLVDERIRQWTSCTFLALQIQVYADITLNLRNGLVRLMVEMLLENSTESGKGYETHSFHTCESASASLISDIYLSHARTWGVLAQFGVCAKTIIRSTFHTRRFRHSPVILMLLHEPTFQLSSASLSLITAASSVNLLVCCIRCHHQHMWFISHHVDYYRPTIKLEVQIDRVKKGT